MYFLLSDGVDLRPAVQIGLGRLGMPSRKTKITFALTLSQTPVYPGSLDFMNKYAITPMS